MDSFGTCSICYISRNLFIPLICSHIICLECPTNQHLKGRCLVCPLCSQQTELESKTLEKLREMNPNPQSQQYNHSMHQIESGFHNTIENIKKTFSYLHQQLCMKQQSLMDEVARQYEGELNKFQLIRVSLKELTQRSSSKQVSSKFLKMLKGSDFHLNINHIQKQIMDLQFNFHKGPSIHKYVRCSHQSIKNQDKNRNFQQDKSYTKIMNILNKSRNTLQSHMKSIIKGETYRSIEDSKSPPKVGNKS